MYRYFLLIIIYFICVTAFAMQVKNVVDNETISAKISSLDITRIVVRGDRIKNLRGVKGTYLHENDEKNGEVFIQPANEFRTLAFTILIETEQGHHFILLLHPVVIPSETLMLVPKEAHRLLARRFEKAFPYELTLLHLIRAMKREDVPDGFIVKKVDDKQTYKIGNIAKLHLKSIYEGLNLQGEVFELTNTQSKEITLNEREFYKKGTRAISLERINVPSYSKITVYRVVSHV